MIRYDKRYIYISQKHLTFRMFHRSATRLLHKGIELRGGHPVENYIHGACGLRSKRSKRGRADLFQTSKKIWKIHKKKHETHGEHPRKIRTSATFIVVSSFFPCFSISVIMNWRVSRSKHYHAIWSFGYGPEPAWTNQPCWLITTEEGNTTGWPFWPKLTSSPSWFEFKDLLFWWNYCMLNHIAICVTSRNSTLFGKCLAEDHHFSRIFPFFGVSTVYPSIIPVTTCLAPVQRKFSMWSLIKAIGFNQPLDSWIMGRWT